jgi:hypothetical protein
MWIAPALRHICQSTLFAVAAVICPKLLQFEFRTPHAHKILPESGSPSDM